MALKLWMALAGALAMAASCDGKPEARSAPPGPGASESRDVNLDLWLERLEVSSRELFSARQAVVDAVGLEEGARVADIGAGTGLFTLLFAEAVGPSGVVYAVDIEPRFLELINQRAIDHGYDNIVSVLGRENAVTLPKHSVDVVFISDTYHYFGDRRTIMETIHNALRPGGRLVVVDYDLGEDEMRPPDRAHVAFGKAGVISEVEFFGFSLLGESEVEGLDENFFITFSKPSAQ